jgi:hypothetical protein
MRTLLGHVLPQYQQNTPQRTYVLVHITTTGKRPHHNTHNNNTHTITYTTPQHATQTNNTYDTFTHTMTTHNKK